MKTGGKILIAFYIVCFIYICAVKPIVILTGVLVILVTLGILKLLKINMK